MKKFLFASLVFFSLLKAGLSNAEPASSSGGVVNLNEVAPPSTEPDNKKIIPVEPPKISDQKLAEQNLPEQPEEAAQVDEKETVTPEELSEAPTIFFRKNDHEKIIKIFNGYRNKVKNRTGKTSITSTEEDLLGDALSKLTNSDPEQVTKIPAYFYLNSIIFKKGSKPRVWLNGKKFEEGQELDGLKLSSATQDKAEFVWRIPPGVDTSEWQARIDESQKNSEGKVDFSPSSGELAFTLKVNQWLDVTKTLVVEGKTMGRLAIKDDDPIYYDPKKAPPKEEKPVAEKTEEEMLTAPEAAKKVPDAPTVGAIKESFPVGADGHYSVLVEINEKRQAFVIDTGATITSVPKSVAKDMGIEIDDKSREMEANTAGGKRKVKVATVAEVKLGKLSVKNLDVAVFNDKDLGGICLLGQNFLNQFDSETKSGVLTLSKPAN